MSETDAGAGAETLLVTGADDADISPVAVSVNLHRPDKFRCRADGPSSFRNKRTNTVNGVAYFAARNDEIAAPFVAELSGMNSIKRKNQCVVAGNGQIDKLFVVASANDDSINF